MKTKKILLGIWLGGLVSFVAMIIYDPSYLEPQKMAAFLREWGIWLGVIYTLGSLIRGLFLVPGTLFIVTGALLYPDLLWYVFLVSMMGVVVSSWGLYHFPKYFGLDVAMEKRYAKHLRKLEKKMNTKGGFGAVALWSASPFLPTEPIYYIAATSKMPFKKMLLAVLIGETPLVYVYTFFTGWAISYLG